MCLCDASEFDNDAQRNLHFKIYYFIVYQYAIQLGNRRMTFDLGRITSALFLAQDPTNSQKLINSCLLLPKM